MCENGPKGISATIDPELRSTAMVLDVFARLVSALHAQDGLSHLQWVILRRLADPDGAGSTVGELADFIALSAAPTSRAVRILSEKQLVQVELSATDQRRKHLRVTPQGETLLARDPLLQVVRSLGLMDDQTRLAVLAGIGQIGTDLTQSANPSSARVLLNRSGDRGEAKTRSAP